MSLHLRRWPRPPGRLAGSAAPSRLVLLHGFTQNVDCWGPFADHLAARAAVDAIDAPGHGRSDPVHDRADLWRAAELVHRTIEADQDRAPVVVGYSMGGRLALHLALGRPQSVAGLVLIGATPGIVDEAERADRRQADDALAERIRAEPIDVFLDRWLANPMFAGLSPAAAARAARRRNRPEGLAASLESCGTGTQHPLWDRLAELEMPVLLITGSEDAKFRRLAERMGAELSNAAVTTISLTGTHAVHLEQPAEAADTVLGWLVSL